MNTQAVYNQSSGSKLLFVMAAEPEYGPHLRTRFTPLMTGVAALSVPLVVDVGSGPNWERAH